MASAGALIRQLFSASATDCVQVRCTRFSGVGSIACRRHSPPTTCRLATPMSWPSASSRFLTRACSTDLRPGAPFFEGVIRDHLYVGRPDQVVLIFERKVVPRTPG